MRRFLEITFRHMLPILALIALLPIIGVGVSYVLVPKTYQSTASLWAWHRYEVISPTGPESDLSATPAETQATALTQLLETQKFDLEVAQGIDLVPTLKLSANVLADPQLLDNAIFLELAKNVVVTPQAYQLYTISYINRYPQIAQQIVQSVIQQFGMQSTSLSIAVGTSLLADYQSQLTQAEKQQNQDVAAELRYAVSHPNLTQQELANDPQYQQLDNAVKQDTTIVQNIQSEINTVQTSMAADSNVSTLFQVQDPPQVPQLPLSRTTKFLTGGGIGLGIALLAAAVYLIILVRRDRSIYSAYDLQDLIIPPVLMQLPTLTSASVRSLTKNQTLE